MLCYKDRAFCDAECANKTCLFRFNDEDRIGAKKWWYGLKGEPTVEFSDMSKHCPDYIPLKLI